MKVSNIALERLKRSAGSATPKPAKSLSPGDARLIDVIDKLDRLVESNDRRNAEKSEPHKPAVFRFDVERDAAGKITAITAHEID